LQNFGVNVANAGYVVAYVTLELSEKKSLKRIGSMRLEIPISEYNEIAKDKEFMKRKITEMNEKYGNMFSQSNGKIYIKEYPSGMAGVMDIENYVKLVYELTGKKIDFLIVDYIQIMKPDQSLKIDNMLYLKGKHLAEGLRAIASKYDLVCLTATQISKEKYNANDIILSDLPESKAIADTADTV
jgi:replicative DNA helicase